MKFYNKNGKEFDKKYKAEVSNVKDVIANLVTKFKKKDKETKEVIDEVKEDISKVEESRDIPEMPEFEAYEAETAKEIKLDPEPISIEEDNDNLILKDKEGNVLDKTPIDKSLKIKPIEI